MTRGPRLGVWDLLTAAFLTVLLASAVMVPYSLVWAVADLAASRHGECLKSCAAGAISWFVFVKLLFFARGPG